jgi:predicted transcriptional regulator
MKGNGRVKEYSNAISFLENEARIQVLKMLLKLDRLCQTDIARELYKMGYQMKFPAVIKHVRKLERARLLRSGSDESDHRKTFYALQSKERVQEIMRCLTRIRNLLASSSTFEETARLANMVQASMS